MCELYVRLELPSDRGLCLLLNSCMHTRYFRTTVLQCVICTTCNRLLVLVALVRSLVLAVQKTLSQITDKLLRENLFVSFYFRGRGCVREIHENYTTAKYTAYTVLYHSYQDCPIDFHMLHSELFHDHIIVPPTISWFPVSVYIIHMNPMCVAQSAARGTVKSELGQ